MSRAHRGARSRPGGVPAASALRELISRYSKTHAFDVAQAYAWRGEPDRAIEWLRRAMAQNDGDLDRLRTTPMLRAIRGDPRYAALLRDMKLPTD